VVRKIVLKTSNRIIQQRIALLKRLAEEHKYLKKNRNKAA